MKRYFKSLSLLFLLSCFLFGGFGCDKNTSTVSNYDLITKYIESVTSLGVTNGYHCEKTMPALSVNGSVEFARNSEDVYIEFVESDIGITYEMSYSINSKHKKDIDFSFICELINLVSDEKIDQPKFREFVFNKDDNREPWLEDTQHVEVKQYASDFFESLTVSYSLEYSAGYPESTDMKQYVESSGKVSIQ